MRRIHLAILAGIVLAAATAAKAVEYKYEFDMSGATNLTAWTETKLRPMVETWYPKLCALLAQPGFTPPGKVRFRYRDNHHMHGTPAWAAGNEISLNRQWFEGNTNGEALGCVVHEMVHVVQAYRYGRRRAPSWVQEGLADYVRWFLYEPESFGAIPNFRDQNTRHDSSYRVTAHFLNYVELKYGSGRNPIYRRLNAAARDANYSDDFWKEATGKGLAELDAEWKQAFTRPPRERRRQPQRPKTP